MNTGSRKDAETQSTQKTESADGSVNDPKAWAPMIRPLAKLMRKHGAGRLVITVGETKAWFELEPMQQHPTSDLRPLTSGNEGGAL